MKFIKKGYYEIEEILYFLGITKNDLEYFVQNRKVFLSAYLEAYITTDLYIVRTVLEKGYCFDIEIPDEDRREGRADWESIPEKVCDHEGLLGLYPQDAIKLLQGESVVISNGIELPFDYVKISHPMDGIPITKKQTKISAQQFEKLRALTSADGLQFTHTENYSRITHNGTDYIPGKKRAAAIKIMHEAAGTNGGWCNGNDILSTIEAGSDRIPDLFKKKKNRDWKPLIESDGAGNFRLRKL